MLRARSRGEAGNSIVEFVVVFCLLSATILLLSVQALAEVRLHLAALAGAKEGLRTMQLQSDEVKAERAALRVLDTFGISNKEAQFAAICQSSQLVVRVAVRQVSERVLGGC